MTFWASKSEQRGYADTPLIDVQVTYGPIVIKVTENPGHLRSFHGELGKLLDGIDAEKADK